MIVEKLQKTARHEKLLVAAFHPELTDDLRFHKYFLDIIKGVKIAENDNR